MVVDTSVVVAAFASWHALHKDADRTVGTGARLVAHCALEAFSVLTRLPAPHRASAPLVRDFLAARFAEPYIGLDAEQYRALIPRLVELGISGGATYDALVAATSRAAGATLISCDQRAAQTYQRMGADFRLLG
jgi:predicted nucleic acid-binding protein